jgi:hypothetical protein
MMKNFKCMNTFMQINDWIKRENTGTPREFALKLHMTESNLRRYIRSMKSAGAPIKYSRLNATYYYLTGGSFVFAFVPETKHVEKHTKIPLRLNS